jgi:2-dehydro-3-deoxyphosphogluconate aldolase/(4S)-4-hydroxy-2-oxoglutarate aldolase
MSASLDELAARPIIPVITIDDARDAVPLTNALIEGGIDVIEITFRTAAAADAITAIAKSVPKMLLGAGTVLTAEQAKLALDAGVAFGLAPGLNPKMIEIFAAAETLFIPGVMTPSEIEQGLSLGCRLLKFFPAEQAGGAGFIRALSGPYASSGVRFCPTGGVTLDNMNDYLSLPIVAAVGGSWLATAKQIAAKEWSTITRQSREALARVKR